MSGYVPHAPAALAFALALWLPVGFACYAMANRRFNLRMLLLLIAAEGIALGLAVTADF